jgi:metal-responsive CopG/Arc/MetJ family transcriptional regulator
MANQPKDGLTYVGVSSVPVSLAEAATKLAIANGTSRSAIAREAWQKYVDEHSKPKGRRAAGEKKQPE